MNWQFSTTYNWNEVRAWSSFLTFLYVHLALKTGYFLLAVEEKEFPVKCKKCEVILQDLQIHKCFSQPGAHCDVRACYHVRTFCEPQNF